MHNVCMYLGLLTMRLKLKVEHMAVFEQLFVLLVTSRLPPPSSHRYTLNKYNTVASICCKKICLHICPWRLSVSWPTLSGTVNSLLIIENAPRKISVLRAYFRNNKKLLFENIRPCISLVILHLLIYEFKTLFNITNLNCTTQH